MNIFPSFCCLSDILFIHILCGYHYMTDRKDHIVKCKTSYNFMSCRKTPDLCGKYLEVHK